MTVTDAIHAYNVGSLIALSTRELNVLNDLLLQKITLMNQVVRQENVAAEVKADIRKYEAVRDEVARIVEKRTDSDKANWKLQRPESSVSVDNTITII